MVLNHLRGRHLVQDAGQSPIAAGGDVRLDPLGLDLPAILEDDRLLPGEEGALQVAPPRLGRAAVECTDDRRALRGVTCS